MMSADRPRSRNEVMGSRACVGLHWIANAIAPQSASPFAPSSLGCTPVALTVVGSIAFDSVRTPFGERQRMLGGSAVHFALAARFFTQVRIVGPVGDDFSDEHLAFLRERDVDVSDVERVAGGQNLLLRRPLQGR